MIVEKIQDKTRLFSFFKDDSCLFSYHIGDLDDFFFFDCDFIGLVDDSTHDLKEICLTYKGLSTPTVLALGRTDNFFLLLDQLYKFLPNKFFCHYLPIYESNFKDVFSVKELGLHYKMRLKTYPEFPKFEHNKIILLTSNYEAKLIEFFKEAYPESYFESYMLGTKLYFGLLNKEGDIISVAGVHTYSKEYKLAVLGNIATHPEHRRKGYSYLLITYLISQLKGKADYIGLNVKANNINAIKLYKKLGFTICVEYKEGLFEKKENT